MLVKVAGAFDPLIIPVLYSSWAGAGAGGGPLSYVCTLSNLVLPVQLDLLSICCLC